MVESLLESLPPAPWIILFSPLAATAAICLFAMRRPRLAAALSLGGILVSLAGSVGLYLFHSHGSWMPAELSYAWLRAGEFSVDFGFLVDPLSILMLLVVTGVGSCIFLYSIGYMSGDPSTPRYFASLALFAFSMIGIVLANNFFVLFVFWELVALSSYLLIGFWFEKPSAADAGNKAFLVNRVGDFGMVLGIFTIWAASAPAIGDRTFTFTELGRRVPEMLAAGQLSPELLTAGCLLLFCGVAGKSAQFPLYIWLPDAMEGPTPVSALIHAATMVAAGVYLLARVFFLYADLPQTLEIVAWIGGVTATMAALLAVTQDDIKKILAYSTISQLGYMVMAVGLGGPQTAMYHLTTHAFFKALLFLGAGAMIHALHTQDIWEMGGLLKQMPVTACTFLAGTLALCGVFPLSGFFSKDEILVLASERSLPLYVLGLATAGLTAFYMSRAVWVAVLGPRRAHKGSHAHSHPHEAPWVMRLPLVLLAFWAVLGGFIGIPEFLAGHHGADHGAFHWSVAILSSLVALGGLTAGSLVYARLRGRGDPLREALGVFSRVLARKFFLDEAAYAIAGFFNRTIAGRLFWFDGQAIIRTGVNGTARAVSSFAGVVRRSQTGYVQHYAAVFVAGLLVILALVSGGRP